MNDIVNKMITKEFSPKSYPSYFPEWANGMVTSDTPIGGALGYVRDVVLALWDLNEYETTESHKWALNELREYISLQLPGMLVEFGPENSFAGTFMGRQTIRVFRLNVRDGDFFM